LIAMRATWRIKSDVIRLFGPGRHSPAITTRLVVASVSQATRASGYSAKNKSTTSSEMRSQTLSGWPSETDSLVNR